MCPVGFVHSFLAVLWEDNLKPFLVLIGGFLFVGFFIGLMSWLIEKLLKFLGI